MAIISDVGHLILPVDDMPQALAFYRDLLGFRVFGKASPVWTVIETEQPTIPSPFYDLMLFWMALMFMGFGLCAPRNRVVAVTVLICAVSLASVIYVILELEDSSSGLIAISSQPLRDALADIDRP